MNPEVKQLWIDALRSDEYEQGRGYLRKDGKFCCLGVLCDLAVKAGVRVTVDVDDDDVYHYMSQDGSIDPAKDQDKILPEAVVLWAGVESTDPSVYMPEDDSSSFMEDDMSLTHVNDEIGLDFGQIADAIERSL